MDVYSKAFFAITHLSKLHSSQFLSFGTHTCFFELLNKTLNSLLAPFLLSFFLLGGFLIAQQSFDDRLLRYA